MSKEETKNKLDLVVQASLQLNNVVGNGFFKNTAWMQSKNNAKDAKRVHRLNLHRPSLLY